MGVFQLEPLAGIARVIHKTSFAFHERSTKAGLEQKAVHRDEFPGLLYIAIGLLCRRQSTNGTIRVLPITSRSPGSFGNISDLLNAHKEPCVLQRVTFLPRTPMPLKSRQLSSWLPAGSGCPSPPGAGGARTAPPASQRPLRQAPSSKPSPWDLSPGCPSNLPLWLSFPLN